MDAYLACMEARKIRDGIKLAMDVSREGNGFIQVSRFASGSDMYHVGYRSCLQSGLRAGIRLGPWT